MILYLIHNYNNKRRQHHIIRIFQDKIREIQDQRVGREMVMMIIFFLKFFLE